MGVCGCVIKRKLLVDRQLCSCRRERSDMVIKVMCVFNRFGLTVHKASSIENGPTGLLS